VLITFLAPLLAKFALKFGPAEFFAVQLLTFCSFVGMSKEPPAKVICAMMLGFALGRRRHGHGHRPAAHDLRLSRCLLKGFDFLIAVIGLFGIGEILLTMEEGPRVQGQEREDQPEGRVPDLVPAAVALEDLPALGRRSAAGWASRRAARRRPRS
jgi:putative tricarboxylic transport membrane protein